MPVCNKIQILPKDVVDKIAAGEVVQRAAAALKEMLENSLDANATEIHLVVHSVCAFHLTDNGNGIPKDDLALACTRHATSKLRSASDLESIASFGFRGEALASVSMVANVQIHSRTPDSAVGYTQRYAAGRPVSESPTPCARKVGTTIRVTNLFHNLPTRQTLRFANEYAAMLKVMQSYAIHYPHITFICNKIDKPADLITQPTTVATDTASAIFGLNTKQWLQHSRELQQEEDGLIYKAQMYISEPSSSNGNRNKAISLPFLLFVNHRLVANTTLQAAVEQVIAEHSLHKKAFTYLAVNVPPHQVDVNVHPTKQSVVLYHLDKIANDLAESLKDRFIDSVNMTTMEQKKSSSSKRSKKRIDVDSNTTTTTTTTTTTSSTDDEAEPTPKKVKVGSIDPKIRVNSNAGALDSFIVSNKEKTPKEYHHPSCPVDMSQPGAFAVKDCRCVDIRYDWPTVGTSSSSSVVVVVKPVVPTTCHYASIRKLRGQIVKRCNANALKGLRHAAWVGQISHHRSLLQIGPDLVLWSHTTAANHLFRQLALWKFGDCPLAVLPTGIDICRVIGHLLQVEQDGEPQNDEISKTTTTISPTESNHRMAQQATECLIQNKDMLLEYFSIRIDSAGSLTGLPVLLDGHVANAARLPLFLLRLATCVDYHDEQSCFDGVCRELGIFYGFTSPKEIFPAVRRLLQPPNDIELQPMTSLKECYKVFERC